MLSPPSHRVTFAILVANMLWLGVVLLVPYGSFGSLLSWNLMAHIATGPVWGAAFFIVGLSGVAGARLRHPLLLVAVAGTLFAAHAIFAALMVFTNPASWSAGISCTLAAAAYWLLFRLALRRSAL